MATSGEVVVRTDRFDDDLDCLTEQLGFRIHTIYPADAPRTAVLDGSGMRLRLERTDATEPVRLRLPSDSAASEVTLPGGSIVMFRPPPGPLDLPPNDPSLVVSRNDASNAPGRAGMMYRDLIPDRWGGRFIASHITIPDGGPVPDYVHFHRIRFQMIFVKAGWVRVVYEDQGDPFVMEAGDCVLQPPEIRHRVLESSPGLEVIEIGCPAEHHTFADWTTDLPTTSVERDRDFGGQRFVRHVAADAEYGPWRFSGWECRDTGIGAATDGLAGARVARPLPGDALSSPDGTIAHDTEYAQLVVLDGSVHFAAGNETPTQLGDGDSVAIPANMPYRLERPSADCEVLDVTLPADVTIDTPAPAT